MLAHAGWDPQKGYRGSTAFGAAVELGFLLASVEGDEDSSRRLFRCWKSRPAPKPADRWLRIAEENGRLQIEDAEPPDSAVKSSPARLHARLTDAIGRYGPLSIADAAGAVDHGPKSGSVRRALTNLVEQGTVRRLEDGRYEVAP